MAAAASRARATFGSAGRGPAAGGTTAAALEAVAFGSAAGLIAAGAAALRHGTHFLRDGMAVSPRRYHAPTPPAARNRKAANQVPILPPEDGLDLLFELGVLVRRLATRD